MVIHIIPTAMYIAKIVMYMAAMGFMSMLILWPVNDRPVSMIQKLIFAVVLIMTFVLTFIDTPTILLR